MRRKKGGGRERNLRRVVLSYLNVSFRPTEGGERKKNLFGKREGWRIQGVRGQAFDSIYSLDLSTREGKGEGKEEKGERQLIADFFVLLSHTCSLPLRGKKREE